MVTRNTTKTAEAAPEYDFENWSEEDEKKAIAALVPDIKHIIVENNFIGRFPDGAIVKMPLSISLDDVDSLQAESDNPVDQFKSLLTRIGGAEAAGSFSRHDLAAASVMAERFFKIFSRIAGASFPE